MTVKPWYLRTELWVTVLTGVGTLIAAIADWLPPRYAALAATVVSGAYAISRGLAKYEHVQTPPAPPSEPNP